MSLSPGNNLGPYRIVAAIGAGGMGEVYRARDTRLDRDVALKVLPGALADDAERRRRFEQEARHASALNHPNIVAIHDVGNEGATYFVVMELVEGESLRALLQRGSLPPRKLLDIAVQIADALSCAHAAGIVHRDLKPENVMVTRDGRVKLLDFGLARQTETPHAPDATQVSSGTHPGTVLGTSAYMSPEQARGQAVDFRSDLFSFGVVLYEMASGTNAFQRDSAVQTMSAIITDDPPPLEAKVPPPLKWTIDRCLAKEPHERHDSTRDLQRDLQYLRDHLSEAFSSSSGAVQVEKRAPGIRLPLWLFAVLAVFAVLAGLLSGVLLAPARAPRLSGYRFTPLATDRESQGSPAWSPDGRSLAYTAEVNDIAQVFVRSMDSETPAQLTHSGHSANAPFWSPDSRRLYFLDDDTPAGVWTVALAGGDPQPVLAGQFNRATLSPDGKTLAVLGRINNSPLTVWLSSPAGAAPTKYAPAPFETDSWFNMPYVAFSPDGRKLLLAISSFRGEERWLLPFPAGSGSPRRVLEGLQSTFTPMFSWMPDSRRVVVSASPSMNATSRLWMADTRGDDLQALTAGRQGESAPSVSPDGRRIAFTSNQTDFDIDEIPLNGGPARPLVATSRNEYMPAWSERGLAFVTDRNGAREIWVRSRQEGVERPLVSARDFPEAREVTFMTPQFSPDGSRLLYVVVTQSGATRANVWISPASGGTPARLSSGDEIAEYAPVWSPDGNWVAYIIIRNGSSLLVKSRLGSVSSPEVIKNNVYTTVPDWSPSGIVVRAADGWSIVSPDGKESRNLGFKDIASLAFSKDGKTLYGLRWDKAQAILFAIDVASGKERKIGSPGTFYMGTPLNPGVRLSMAPDGASMAVTVVKPHTDIWMLEGFQASTGFLERLGLR